jgi:biotin operon repressor
LQKALCDKSNPSGKGRVAGSKGMATANREIPASQGENKLRGALVSLPDGVWIIIDKDLKGQIGDGDSEIIRNLVIAYLTEKGYLLKGNKGEPTSSDQIASELDVHDTMIAAPTEILEEKGQISQEEFEKRVQKKIHE